MRLKKTRDNWGIVSRRPCFYVPRRSKTSEVRPSGKLIDASFEKIESKPGTFMVVFKFVWSTYIIKFHNQWRVWVLIFLRTYYYYSIRFDMITDMWVEFQVGCPPAADQGLYRFNLRYSLQGEPDLNHYVMGWFSWYRSQTLADLSIKFVFIIVLCSFMIKSMYFLLPT